MARLSRLRSLILSSGGILAARCSRRRNGFSAVARLGLFQQIDRTRLQGQGGLPKRQEGDILSAAFDAADIGPVDAHALGNGFLANANGQPVLSNVRPENLADIHPQDRKQSRILALRIIIHGGNKLRCLQLSDSAKTLHDEPPRSDHVTDYDRAHFDIYLRLLDAAAEGADETEITRIVLGVDPSQEPERAHKRFESHLARARWMSETGYRDLLHS